MKKEWKLTNEKINDLLQQGFAMEAFEKYYSEDVTMQENETEPRIGKDLNRRQCQGFIDNFPDLQLKVLSTAYGEKVSMQEVLFDYTNESGKKILYSEIAVRKWEDGRVIKEKFYYTS